MKNISYLQIISAIRSVFIFGLIFFLKGAYAENKVSVRIGFFPNAAHAQALYAKATGDFANGLNATIEWSSFNAGPSAIEALFAGAIDLSYIGPNPAINGYIKSKGELFTIISGSASGGAALVVREGTSISKASDFNGKVVATPQLGNTQDVAARSWFAGKGIMPKEKGGELNLIPLANPDQLLMFKRKELDAAWTVEPWVSRLEKEGDGKIFLDEKDLWPNGRYVTTHIIVSRKFLAGNKEIVEKLLRAHVNVTKKIQAEKKSLVTILNEQIKKETGATLEPAVLEAALNRIEFTWDPVSTSLKKAADSAHTVGFIKEKPDLSGIYDLSLLNKVLKEANINPVSQDLQ